MARGQEDIADGGAGKGSHARQRKVPARLTESSLINIDYIAVPGALTPYVTTLYHFRCDEAQINEVQPAGIGHLAIFPFGRGILRFPEGTEDRAHCANLLTPSNTAATFEVPGPFHAIGAVMTPLGWAALTGMDADKHANRLLDASDILGAEVAKLGEDLCAAYRSGALDGQACAMEIARYIETNLKKVNSRHASLIEQTNQWLGESLDPSLDSLFERASYSKRQVQRLVERYFGLPPVALKRKYRSLRAAMLWSLPTLTPEFEADVRGAFYDQSHMIREIRLFTGRTPARLGNDSSPYLAEMLDPKNLREIEPRNSPDSGKQD